jgi:prepilin signal peptidase PulO-like enzyme (type II secretory pathway)
MPYLFLGFSLVLGLIIGSFINCLVWRLYKEETLMGRSYCPKCRHQIDWYDNIPVVSWIFLGGRCRHCRKPISVQYPLVEFLTGVLFALVFIKFFGAGFAYSSYDFYFWLLDSAKLWWLLADWLAISALTIVFIFDTRWLLISLPAILWSAAGIFGLDLILGYSLGNILLCVLIGAGFFGLQFLLTRGRGIGEGDIWLGGLMGLIFPDWHLLLAALFMSYMLGGATGLVMMAAWGKKLKTKLPLGVFLALGSIIALFFGRSLIGWYLGLLGA